MIRREGTVREFYIPDHLAATPTDNIATFDQYSECRFGPWMRLGLGARTCLTCGRHISIVDMAVPAGCHGRRRAALEAAQAVEVSP